MYQPIVDLQRGAVAGYEALARFADRIDAWIPVEGIETEQAARRCLRLEVPLAQGWFFGPAEAGWSDIEPGAFAALADLLDVRMTEGLQAVLTVAPTVRVDNMDVADTVFASSETELARRLSTGRAYDAALPTVVADSGGRYVGVVTVQRLMAHLADASVRTEGGR